MGENGFIASIMGQMEVPLDRVKFFDFSDFNNRDSFLENILLKDGVSFEQQIQEIPEEYSYFIVFFGINSENAIDFVEDVSDTISECFENKYLILDTTICDFNSPIKDVKIQELDILDISTYIKSHEDMGKRIITNQQLELIKNHTSGSPYYLDLLIKKLKFSELEDIISDEISCLDTENNSHYKIITESLSRLEKSSDDNENRAYKALIAIFAYSNGVQLKQIERFYGPHKIYYKNIEFLLKISLIDTYTPINTFSDLEDSFISYLFVPMFIRNIIERSIDKEKLLLINMKAIEKYFGDKWKEGEIYGSYCARKIKVHTSSNREIQNGCDLITDFFNYYGNNEKWLGYIIRLSLSFSSLLKDSERFHSGASFCYKLISLLEGKYKNIFTKEINIFKYKYAGFLRMIGRKKDAVELFNEIDFTGFSKYQIQSAKLILALCYESFDEDDKARETAKEIIKIDKNSLPAIQADFIISGQIDDHNKKLEKYNSLLKKARRKGSTIIKNNILIEMYKYANDSEKEDIRKEVLMHKDLDYYNYMRILSKKTKEIFSHDNLVESMTAYYFLYNERLTDLFNKYHEKLWESFIANGDIENMIIMFRESSFMWRLNNMPEIEMKYLLSLKENIEHLTKNKNFNIKEDNLFYIYFMERNSRLLT